MPTFLTDTVRNMRASFVRIYLALCIAAFIGIFAFFFIGLTRARDATRERSAREFIALQKNVERLWAELPVREAAARLANDLERTARQNARGGVPLLLAIVEPDVGVEYLWTINPRLLPVDGLPGPGQTLTIGTDDILQVRYRASLPLPDGNRRELTAVFQLLDQTTIFGVLRDTLIALLALLSLAVLVAIVGLLGGRGNDAATCSDGTDARNAIAAPRQDRVGVEPTPAYREAIAELDAELERAAFHEQDLTCAIVDLSAKGAPADYYRTARSSLTEFLGQAGRCFAGSGHRELVVFPNMRLSDAIVQLERFQRVLRSARTRSGVRNVDLWSGMSSRNGRLVEGTRMIGECMTALRRAKKTGSRIIGFEPDPNRYREYLRISD